MFVSDLSETQRLFCGHYVVGSLRGERKREGLYDDFVMIAVPVKQTLAVFKQSVTEKSTRGGGVA